MPGPGSAPHLRSSTMVQGTTWARRTSCSQRWTRRCGPCTCRRDVLPYCPTPSASSPTSLRSCSLPSKCTPLPLLCSPFPHPSSSSNVLDDTDQTLHVTQFVAAQLLARKLVCMAGKAVHGAHHSSRAGSRPIAITQLLRGRPNLPWWSAFETARRWARPLHVTRAAQRALQA